MTTLDTMEMRELVGGGFWGGVGCGLGLVVAFTAMTSPDPFSKIALLSYGSTLVGCAAAF